MRIQNDRVEPPEIAPPPISSHLHDLKLSNPMASISSQQLLHMQLTELNRQKDPEIILEECANFSNCSVIATSCEAYEFLRATEPWGTTIKYVDTETGAVEFHTLPTADKPCANEF